jgi:TPR repeat protein
LGHAYRRGEGVEVDAGRAFTLFKRGCDADEQVSCADLGNLYYLGQGVERDHAKAIELLAPACDGGNIYSCNLAAWVWSTSWSLEERQPDRAVRFARKAVDAKPAGREYRDTLAAALASSGRYNAAAKEQQAVILDHVRDGAVSQDYYLRLHAYRAGYPWRQSL